MTLGKIIIIVAVIAFIIAICAIYFKEIKNCIKEKFTFKRKKSSKKETKEEKPKETKEQKKEPTPSVEEFKPIMQNFNKEEERDDSLERLFEDEDFPFGMEDFDDSFLFETPKSGGIKSEKQVDEFEDFKRMVGKRFNEESQTSNNIAEKIKKLPPEIKVMLMDNILKKRDDV